MTCCLRSERVKTGGLRPPPRLQGSCRGRWQTRPVITAAVVTTGIAADEHHLTDVLWQHHRLSGLGMREVVADA